MKKYFYLLFLVLVNAQVFAQQDTVADHAQRVKINTLLKSRSENFGQYEQSLNQRTGIFGWQTKKDIKNSNEILRQIVLNDNHIFKELKLLMDYKDLQHQQKMAIVDHSTERIANYMQTIKKLQDQNDQLRIKAGQVEKGKNIYIYIIVFLFLVIAGGLYFFNKKLKGYEKRIV